MKKETLPNAPHTSSLEVGDLFTLKLNANGIVEIDLHNNVIQIEKEHLVLLKDALKEIGGGKKNLLFIKASDFLGISKEASQYTALPEASEYTFANAVLIESLAKKLLFNFYLRFSKPVVPTKGFTNRTEAFEWLMSLKS